MQQTLSIIKPDATTRNITGSINKLIEDSGLRIIAQKNQIFFHYLVKQSYFKMKKELQLRSIGLEILI